MLVMKQKKGSLQREFDTRAATTENSIILMKNALIPWLLI